MKITNKYDDIIHLPHHVSKTRPQMSIHDRAAQFAPFAALTGHSAAIKETERLTEGQVELDESEITLINEKLRIICEKISEHPEIIVTYFVPDEKKSGGKYITLEGTVKKMDLYRKELVLMDETRIELSDIVEICEI